MLTDLCTWLLAEDSLWIYYAFLFAGGVGVIWALNEIIKGWDK